MDEEDEQSKFDELVQRLEEAIRKEERKLYGEKTIIEALHPKNVGEFENPDGKAKLSGPHGDTMGIQIRVEDGIITDCKFTTDGRGATVACGSVLTQLVKGKSINEAARITETDILAALGGLPEDNLYCPTLAVKTLQAALDDYRSKR